MGNRFKGGIEPGAMPPLHQLPRQPGAVLRRPPVLPLQDRRLPLRPARLPAGQRDRARPAGHRHGVRQRDGREGHPGEAEDHRGAHHARARTAAAARRTCAAGATAGGTCGSCCCSARAGCSSCPASSCCTAGLGIGAAVAAGPLTIGGVSFDVDTLVAASAMVGDRVPGGAVLAVHPGVRGRRGLPPRGAEGPAAAGKLSLERGLLAGAAVGLAGLVGLDLLADLLAREQVRPAQL